MDDGGFEVASARTGTDDLSTVTVLQFRPRADTFFRCPRGSGPIEPLGARATDGLNLPDPSTFRGRRYFLEISPPGGPNAPPAVPVRLGVENRLVPQPGFDPRQRPRPSRFWAQNPTAWPTSILVLGGWAYGRTKVVAFLTRPSGPDASLILARELSATKLNCGAGVDCSAIARVVTEADVLLDRHAGSLPFGVHVSSKDGQLMLQHGKALAAWNSRPSPKPGDHDASAEP